MRNLSNAVKKHSNSLLLSLAMSFSFINETIGINGSSLITLPVIVVLLLVSVRQMSLRIYPATVTVITCILFAFIGSYLRLGFLSHTFSYLAYFCAFGIIFLVIGTQESDLCVVLQCNVIIGLVGTVVLRLRGFDHMNTSAIMGLSYGYLPLLLSAISGLICYRRHKVLNLLGIVFLGFTTIQIAPRGIWICVAAYLALAGFYFLCRKGDPRQLLKKKIVLLGTFAVVLIVLLVNLEQIVVGVNNFLVNNLNLHIKALEKFVFYFRKGDVLNGRQELWSLAGTCIQSNVLIGKGIGYFEMLAGGSHTHNIFLQALCEGGLVFLIPICAMLFGSIKYLLSANGSTPKEDYILFVLLFSCGFVPLIISSTYWILTPFWIFLGHYQAHKYASEESTTGFVVSKLNYLLRELIYCVIGLKHVLFSNHLNMEFRAKASLGSVFEGYNKLSHHCHFSGELGYGSYIGDHSIVEGKIGRYCSIAANVTFVTRTHPVTTFVSSHPCFYSTKKQSGFSFVSEQKFDEIPKLKNSKYSVIVGNDVYIEHGATIIGPVVIGDGAVIAANATVTHDVEPYSIVGGTPARQIKKRFSDEQISFLMDLQWWNKDIAWVKKHAEHFCCVPELMDAVRCDESDDLSKERHKSMEKVAVILTQPIENSTSSMIRCKGILDALAKIGYEITCFCPNADTESIYYGKDSALDASIQIKRYGSKKVLKVRDKNIGEAKSLKKKIVAVAYTLFKKVDVFGASLQYLRYRKHLCKQLAAGNYDILLTFSDPMTAHMIGAYCKRRLNIKYVQQWGDPLTTDIISKNAQPRWMRYLIESSLLSPADRVCYVSPLTCDEQKTLFRKYADRMIFLPTPCVEYEKPAHTASGSNQVRIGYFGSYNLIARDIRPLYEAASRVKECSLRIIGDSDVKLKPKENIQLIERVPQKELTQYLRETDVLVCLMNSKGNQVPGKVYHYAGSYQEILFIKDGELGGNIEEYFSQYNRYTFVENDPDKIEAVLRNYAMNGVPERVPLEAFRAEHVAAELLRNI